MGSRDQKAESSGGFFSAIGSWGSAVQKSVSGVAATPDNDKFQCTYFAHKINSFDTAPKKLLASDTQLRPDRYALA